MQLLFLLAACMASSATAAITLFDLQPIALFSDSCTQAYGTQIMNCDNTMFAPFDNDATCSRNCMSELNTLARTLQKACQSDGVKPNTVIAHAFQGDLANWLCAIGPFSTQQPTVASGTATNAKATSSAAASTSTTTSASTTTDQDSSTTEASSTTDSSTSTDAESSTESSDSSSSVITTFSTTTTSITATTSQSTSSSSTTSSRPRQTSNFVGDSTPFDQTVFANYAKPVKQDKKNLLLIEILVPAAYRKEKRKSRNSRNDPLDPEAHSPNSIELQSKSSKLVTADKDVDNEAGGKRESLVDGLSVPILDSGRRRQQSYGSCEEVPDEHLSESETDGGYKKRHQIGSEVLDFGESPAAWPNAITQRISKRPSHRAVSSLLPVFDAPGTLNSTSKLAFFKSLGHDTHYVSSEGLPPTSMGLIRGLSKRSNVSNKARTVFSLFGMDGSMAKHTNSGTELSVLTNKAGRPRANAVASSHLPPGTDAMSQSCYCPTPNLELEIVRSRIVSWSRYLDEISQIGASRTSVASISTPDDEASSAVDSLVATAKKRKAHTLTGGRLGETVEEENPWQNSKSAISDLNKNLQDLDGVVGVTEGVETAIGDDTSTGEGLPKAGLIGTLKKDESKVLITVSTQGVCEDGICEMPVVERSHSTSKTILSPSPSPKRTKSTTNNKSKSSVTVKSGAPGKERKPFVVPGLADVSEAAENSVIGRANSQAKGGVTKQRALVKGSNKKDSGIVTNGEKK